MPVRVKIGEVDALTASDHDDERLARIGTLPTGLYPSIGGRGAGVGVNIQGGVVHGALVSSFSKAGP